MKFVSWGGENSRNAEVFLKSRQTRREEHCERRDFYTNGIAGGNFFFIRQMAEVRPLIYVYTPNLLRTKFTFLPDKWSHSPVRSFDCLISHWIRDWDLKICGRANIELFETAEKVFLLWINLWSIEETKTEWAKICIQRAALFKVINTNDFNDV